MNLEEILLKLEGVDKKLLEYQLCRNMSLIELGGIYKLLLSLKDEFLDISFVNEDVNEIDQLRFLINEAIVKARIHIKEKLGQSIEYEHKRLKKLYQGTEV